MDSNQNLQELSPCLNGSELGTIGVRFREDSTPWIVCVVTHEPRLEYRREEEVSPPSKGELRSAITALLDAGAAGSTTLRAVLDELTSTLGVDVRPQKQLVKDLLLSALQERAAA